MTMTYANVLTRALQILQDTTGATYDKTTEMAYWIEDSLKEISKYDPHIVDVIFKIESRTGTDVTGTASSLTDLAKLQFVAGDATYEKVVHNTNDNTWAVVLANSSTSVNTLSADIMDANEGYEIFNKRCTNSKQIYIGDVTDYLWIDSVEYPLGTKRNWKVYGEVLEIDVDTVANSDSTLTNLGNIDVLVRFAMPHVLSQLTDWDGELTANQSEGDVRIAIDGMGASEIIEVGEQFHLENHRSVYIVNRQVTMSSGAEDVDFYPPLEAAASDGDDVTFVRSTLKPQHENLLIDLIAATAVLNDNITKINAINKGGLAVWEKLQGWAERRMARVEAKLRGMPPRTKRRYPTS